MDKNVTGNRRTFLSWLHFAVVLGGLAVGLLNFGDKVCFLFLLYLEMPSVSINTS